MNKRKIKITTRLDLESTELIYDILWDIFGNLLKDDLTNEENFAQIYKTRLNQKYTASQIYTAYYAMSKRKRKLEKKYDKAKEKELQNV